MQSDNVTSKLVREDEWRLYLRQILKDNKVWIKFIEKIREAFYREKIKIPPLQKQSYLFPYL